MSEVQSTSYTTVKIIDDFILYNDEYYEDYYLEVEAADLVGQMNYTSSWSTSHIFGGSRIVYLANDDVITANGASFIIGNDGSQTDGCVTITARNADLFLTYTLPRGYYDFTSEGATGFYIESLSSADIPIHIIVTDTQYKSCFGVVVHEQGNDPSYLSFDDFLGNCDVSKTKSITFHLSLLHDNNDGIYEGSQSLNLWLYKFASAYEKKM